jgi:beta-lactamase class D
MFYHPTHVAWQSVGGLLLGYALLLSPLASAEDTDIAQLFAQQGIEGTIVIASLQTGHAFVHNDRRARQRFSSASTFKVFNTLIALEERVIAGKDDTLAWDGRRYDFPDWNRDQTLETAFKVSCVWCYQELARRIGADAYARYLRQADYGELSAPFEVTTFWLDGALQISAAEQVEFMRKLVLHQLPFSPGSFDTLKEVMLAESTPAYTLYAKTGWAMAMDPQVGWYVGYVETQDDTWLFATNLEIRGQADLPLRQKLTVAALRRKGVIH